MDELTVMFAFATKEVSSSLSQVSQLSAPLPKGKNAITLPETNIVPENGWLEDDRFLLGRPICRGYVSLGECN